jgi:hypothetical protein
LISSGALTQEFHGFDGEIIALEHCLYRKGRVCSCKGGLLTLTYIVLNRTALQFGNIAQRQHRLMLFQQGFPIGSSHFPTAHDTIIASNLFPETSLEIPDLQSSWNDLAVHDKDHTVRQRRKQSPPAIATQAIAGLFATGPPINPRVWSVQKYELAQSHIADGSVCSTPPLTASIGSLPESLASNSCQTPFSPSGPSSRDVFVKLS